LTERDDGFDYLDKGNARGCLTGLGALVLSAGVSVWIGWLAWKLIEKQAAGDLLILAAILLAFPARHLASKALERERQRDLLESGHVSEGWLRRQHRS
jgi:hypothetical protein